MGEAGRPRKPIVLQEQKRRVHRSNAEKGERAKSERAMIVPFTDVSPPSYLTTKKQKTEFCDIASMLHSVSDQLMTELDVDVLARYIIAKDNYLEFTKLLKAELRKSGSDGFEVSRAERIQRMQNTAFNQAQSCASSLGLTVSSRLKLDVERKEDEPKQNRFSKFDKEGEVRR